MIKDFENYKKAQTLANGSTQWKNTKTGAKLVIDDNATTRAFVRWCFEMQESGEHRECYTKENAHYYD